MSFFIHPSCKVHPSVRINVTKGYIGKDTIINENVVIEGFHVEIGRESFIDRYSTIGGGSCFDSCAFLMTGDWFHMGVNSQVNIARGVNVGHEVGIGIDSKIFTHGAYIDSYNLGAPVQWAGVRIGDNVWLPNAWVNPGVSIGSNVVVGARSLVTRNIPDGALAAGSPARVIQEHAFPRFPSKEIRKILLLNLADQIKNRLLDNNIIVEVSNDVNNNCIILQSEFEITKFDLAQKIITGHYSKASYLAKDQLRRNGIRFRFEGIDGSWNKWEIEKNNFIFTHI